MKFQKTLKVFTKPDCPRCPAAKNLIKKISEKVDGEVKIEFYDTNTPEGLGEATFYQVMSVPTLLLFGVNKTLIKTWVETPKEEEVLKAI